MSEAEIKRRADAALKAMAEASRAFQADHEAWRNRQHFFPSSTPGDRGACSPLGGQARVEEKTESSSSPTKQKGFVW
jgi:hypothetical protein